MSNQMTADQQFFYDNAGSSYNPQTETPEQGKIKGAIALQRAEQRALDLGWRADWRFDPDPDSSFVDTWEPAEQAEWHATEHECYTASMQDASGNTLASLGGIFDPSLEYRRVVEAELALEAMDKPRSIQLDPAELQLIIDALEIIDPDTVMACQMRDSLIARLSQEVN